MAAVTVKALNKTKYDQDNTPSDGNVIDAGMRGAGVLCCVDTYTYTDEEADSVLDINTPPKGSRILDIVLVSACAETSLVFDVGDSADEDRYLDAAVGSAASITRMNEVAGFNYVIGTNDGDDEMIITNLVSTAIGAISIYVFYTPGE